VIVDEIIYVEYVNLPVVVVIIFLFILYYAFHEHAVFTQKQYEHHKEMVNLSMSESKTTARYIPAKEGIELRSPLLYEQIKDIITKNGHYKNPEVNIQVLAEDMDKPVYILADAIKSGGTTFYELIRKTRIKKAKERL